jgi:hypothetical protein
VRSSRGKEEEGGQRAQWSEERKNKGHSTVRSRRPRGTVHSGVEDHGVQRMEKGEDQGEQRIEEWGDEGVQYKGGRSEKTKG